MATDIGWGTINGVHVYITAGNTIKKGPSHLVGKSVDTLKDSTNNSTNNSTPTRDTTKKSSSDTSVKGKNLIPDYDNMGQEEAFEHLSKMGINTIEDAITKQGFNGTPRVMSSKDFDEYVSSGGGIELSRGISSPNKGTTQQYVDALKYGDFYIAGGESYFGQGMYFFSGDSLNSATKYAQGSGGKVISAALSKDAKVLEIKGKNGLTSPEVIKTFYQEVDDYSYGKPVKKLQYNPNNRLHEYKELLESSFIAGDKLKSLGYKIPDKPDVSLLFTSNEDSKRTYFKQEAKFKSAVESAALSYIRKTLPKSDVKLLLEYSKSGSGNNMITASQGYDAIRLSPEYVNEHSSNGKQEILIVLNRTKLTVKED